MVCLIVTFQLRDLSADAYRAHCEQVAPHFAALPGLITKVWLADPQTNTYGGVYLWQDRESLERYLASETFAAIAANPHFTGVSARSFGSLVEPTAATWHVRGWATSLA